MRKFAVVASVLCAVLLLVWLGVDWPLGAEAPSGHAQPGVAAGPAIVREAGRATLEVPLVAATDSPPRQEAQGVREVGSVLHGAVYRPGGEPCAEAVVTAESSGLDEYAFLDRASRERTIVARTTTAADGTYELAVSPGRHHLVRVVAGGFAPAARGSCQAGARVDFHLQFSAVLAGVVRDDGGLPVAGTRVSVRRGELLVGAATSDAQGAYRIDGLPPGAGSVDVQPDTLAAPRDADVMLRPGAVTVHDVTLLAGITIRGRVFDASTRQGIAGAEVGEGLGGRAVRTDASGSFVLVGFAPTHNLSLRASAPGYAASEKMLRGRGTKPEDTPGEVEILLSPGYSVRGRVVDGAGSPLAGVYVAAAAADFGAEHDWFRSDWRSGRTGADGRFDLAGLRVDMQHELVLAHAGLASAVFALPKRTPDAPDVDLGELRLLPGGAVAGSLVDEHGEPVADREVELVGHNGDRWRFLPGAAGDGYRVLDNYVATRRARSDAVGRFRFVDLAPGDYTVWTQKFDSHDRATQEFELPAGGAAPDVRLVLCRGFRLGGRIVMQDGSAVPKCYCSIDPEDGQATSGDVEVRPDGTFEVTGLLPGNYKITVYPYATDADRHSGRSFQSREFAHVTAGTVALQCELPVFGRVRGRVQHADQSPAAGWWVVLHDGERMVDSSAIGPDGRFELTAPTVSKALRLHVVPAAAGGSGPGPVAQSVLSVPTGVGAHEQVLQLPLR